MGGRYLASYLRSWYQHLSPVEEVTILVVAVISILIASLLGTVGSAGSASGTVSLITPFFVLLFIAGSWLGFRTVTTHRPSGYYLFNKDEFLWSEIAKALLVGLGISLIFVWPYYFGGYRATGATSLQLLLYSLDVLLLSLCPITSGVIFALAVRLLSPNAFVRISLLAVGLATVGMLAIHFNSNLTWLESSVLLLPGSQVLLALLLVVVGAVATNLVIIELLFGALPIRNQSLTEYSSALGHVHTFRLLSHPLLMAMWSQWLFVVRNNAIQRRLLAIAVTFLAYPLLAVTLNITTNTDAVNAALVFGLLITATISLRLGYFVFEQYLAMRTLPQANRYQLWGGLLSSSVITGVLALAIANLIVPFPGALATVLIVVTTVGMNVLIFLATWTGEIINHRLGDHAHTRQGNRLLILGVLLAVSLALFASSFYGLVDTLGTICLVTVWATALATIIIRGNRQVAQQLPKIKKA